MVSKTKEQSLNARVNPAPEGSGLNDEVFISSKVDKDGNPIGDHENRAIYSKPGLFKDGEMSRDAIAKLEARSNKELADDRADKLAQEAKEREAAAKPETLKEVSNG